MKLNYSLGIMVMIGTLFLNYPGFTQVTKFGVNQDSVQDSETYYFGLQKNAEPISYKSGFENWKGYCNAFIEILKTNIPDKKIELVPIESKNRFTGKGDKDEKLDAECGADTITDDRQKKELSENGLDGTFSHAFAFTSAKILVKDENKTAFTYYNPSQLQKLKFGVIKGTTTEKLVARIYPSLFNHNRFVFLKDENDAIQKIRDGSIDVYFNDELILKKTQKELQPQNYQKKYSILPDLLSHEDYGIVVFHKSQKKNYFLLSTINKLLDDVKFEPFGDTQIRMFKSPEFNEFRQDIQDINPPVISPPKNYSNGLNFLQRNNLYISFSLELIFISLFIFIILILLIKNRRTNLSQIHTLFPQFLHPIHVITHNHLHTENDNTQRDNMSEAYKYNMSNSNIGNVVDKAETGSTQQSIQHNYPPEEKQNLAEAAAQIQKLLEQLEKTNPTATETDKQAFVTAAISPEHRSRIVKALQAGGEKALEEFLKNPYVNVAIAIVKEWQKAE